MGVLRLTDGVWAPVLLCPGDDCEQVTVEELRGGMVVGGPHVQLAECMRLFAGGVIMAALREPNFGLGGEGGSNIALCMVRDTTSRGRAMNNWS